MVAIAQGLPFVVVSGIGNNRYQSTLTVVVACICLLMRHRMFDGKSFAASSTINKEYNFSQLTHCADIMTFE